MIPIHDPLRLLGNVSPSEFMRKYWQRQPLLIRQAIPGFCPPVSIDGIKELASNPDVESRLIVQKEGGWQVNYGPFEQLPPSQQPNWTVLVQGVNLHNDEIAKLMQAFRFIPDARLDDVMISVATQGGGVGPHFDNYDVFLLQGVGQRRWRIGPQQDLSLREDLPLKILKNFEVAEEYILNPGDMLYLPPHYAHDGIAENDCMTISIGFRSPGHKELLAGVLEHFLRELNERDDLPPLLEQAYQDPDQQAVMTPAEIPEGMIQICEQLKDYITIDKNLITRFLGCWLTEPKPHVFFDEPEELAFDLCESWPNTHYLMLDKRTQMLHKDGTIFINGELISHHSNPNMEKLANQRCLHFAQEPETQWTDTEREWLQLFLESGWAQLIKAP